MKVKKIIEVNFSVVSNDDNTLKAEYKAGFIYGHLLKNQIRSALQ